MNNNFAQLVLDATSAPRFVDFWRSYIGDNNKYTDNINIGGTVSTDNVVALMEWKAGPRFSAKAGKYARAVPTSVFNDARVKPQLSDDDLGEQYGLIRQ